MTAAAAAVAAVAVPHDGSVGRGSRVVHVTGLSEGGLCGHSVVVCRQQQSTPTRRLWWC